MNQFIILLGSNLDAEKNMAEACRILVMTFPDGIRFSEIHRSATLVKKGCPIPKGECATYLNVVCKLQSERTLEDIQLFLKHTETRMGRVRGVEGLGCVTIDLDLVEWNGTVLRPKDAAQGYYKVCLGDL